ncbi:MAG: hypothetical protein K2H85_09370 [Allobaculum sp.]|nr:hypothetical protein [Allobaculum sp.]
MGICALAQDEIGEDYIPNNRKIINEVRTIGFIRKLINEKLKIRDIKPQRRNKEKAKSRKR